jgi:hypothetical protein
MRYEEVAVVLDIPIGTILSRGREMLRRLMDMKEEGPLEPVPFGMRHRRPRSGGAQSAA